jgi:1-acyl-sn-glycerol-3-phosphate acyltransferase
MADMFFAAVHRVVPPVAKAIWRPKVTGLEHVPRSGAVILASNHLSFIDSTMIPVVVPRKVVFLAKSDYFNGTGIKGALVRAWFEGLGMLPVDRDNNSSALASLETALEVLGRGEAFGIYPEGTRSLLPTGYDGVPPGRARRELTDRVMAAIGELSGQEVAGVYNERPADG